MIQNFQDEVCFVLDTMRGIWPANIFSVPFFSFSSCDCHYFCCRRLKWRLPHHPEVNPIQSALSFIQLHPTYALPDHMETPQEASWGCSAEHEPPVLFMSYLGGSDSVTPVTKCSSPSQPAVSPQHGCIVLLLCVCLRNEFGWCDCRIWCAKEKNKKILNWNSTQISPKWIHCAWLGVSWKATEQPIISGVLRGNGIQLLTFLASTS